MRTNLGRLGSALGMELKPIERAAVNGSPSAGLLAEDERSGRLVFILGQLGANDHSRLGQLITHGAAKRATTLIWVSPTFRDEHRAALDWLNERSGGKVRFIGIELQLSAVGHLPPAPSFRVVSRPASFSNETVPRKVAISIAHTERQALYLRFWGKLLAACKLDIPDTPT